MPAGGEVLASNDFTHIQALSVTHKKGTFWATQYHCEYNLLEMARLFLARKERLLNEGFFSTEDDLNQQVKRMEQLYKQPTRKDLRWQLGIGDDVLNDVIRQIEFKNWIEKLVIPTARKRS